MKIFWSWQSDNDQACGRYFVRDVLKKVARELKNVDDPEEVERGSDFGPIAIDFDTDGVAGSPPIADTILRKIREAAVFVADVSPVGETPGKKPLANPNVMIELGYAIRCLGHERIVLVMNQASNAKLDTLPFDLRYLRGPIVYDLPPDPKPEDKKKVAEELKAALTTRIKPCLKVAAEAMEQALRNAHPRPNFKIRLVSSTGDELPESISQHLESLDEPTLDQIKEKHPRLPWPPVEAKEDGFSAAFEALRLFADQPSAVARWTQEQTEGYNNRLSAFYARYERYLSELRQYRLFLARRLEVKLHLGNIGTAAGTDIHVFVDIPKGMSLYEKGKGPTPPGRPEPPVRKPNPSTSAPFLARADSRDYSFLTSKRSDAVWTSVDPDKKQVRFYVKDMLHNLGRPSDAFLLAFDTADDIGPTELRYHILVRECPDAQEGVIDLQISRSDSIGIGSEA